MDWLDQHSASVTAIGTVVLAGITAVYVWLTRALATSSENAIREAQNANRLAREANELSRQSIDLELEERLRGQASKIVARVRPGHMTTGAQTYAVVASRTRAMSPCGTACCGNWSDSIDEKLPPLAEPLPPA